MEIALGADDLQQLIEKGSLQAGPINLTFKPAPIYILEIELRPQIGKGWQYKFEPEGFSTSWSYSKSGRDGWDGSDVQKLLSHGLMETDEATLRFEGPPNGTASISMTDAGEIGFRSWSSSTDVQYDERGKVKSASTGQSQT